MDFDLDSAMKVDMASKDTVSTTAFDVNSIQLEDAPMKQVSPIAEFFRSIMRTSPLEQTKTAAAEYRFYQENPQGDSTEFMAHREKEIASEGIVRQFEAPMMLGIASIAGSAQPLLHIARLAGFTAVEGVLDLKGRLDKADPNASWQARDAAEVLSFVTSAFLTGGGELGIRAAVAFKKAPAAVYFDTEQIQILKANPEIAQKLNVTPEHIDAALNGNSKLQIPLKALGGLVKMDIDGVMRNTLFPPIKPAAGQPLIKDILRVDEGGQPVKLATPGTPTGSVTVVSTLGKVDKKLTTGKASQQTGVEDLDPVTAEEIIKLADKYQLDIRLTGGTERGHKIDGKITHEKGKKADLGVAEKLDAVIKGWGKSLERIGEDKNTEPGYVNPETGAVYWREKNHWDVEVDPAMMKTRIAVEKVITALKGAKSVRGEQETLYSKARSQKMAKALAVRQKVQGEAGFHAELGALKGELPKAEFESLKGKITQSDIDALFRVIADSNKLGFWEGVAARVGLAKLFGEFGGRVPTKGELILLNKVFGNRFVEAMMDKMTGWEKFREGTGQVLNIPRSLMASFDFSAPFRQGVFMVRRKEFWQAFGQQFKFFKSEANLNVLKEQIANHPNFELAKESKLALTDLDVALEGREEAFMSNLAEKIPVIGRGVRASGRAYVGFLNKLRFDVFNAMIKDAERLGLNPQENRDVSKEIAGYINTATGRGDLGALNNSAVTLANIFFSPRLIASRLSLLNPVYYAEKSPYVRQQALKDLASFVAFGSTMTALISLAYSGRVGQDSRSSDFGKAIVNRTRASMWGGFQPYVRMASQLATGKYVSSTTGKVVTLGEGYKPLTRLDILQRQVESKLSPVASFIVTMLKGKTWDGKPVNLGREALDRITPMVAGDLVTLVQNDPSLLELIRILPLQVLSLFGADINTYENK